MHLGIPGEVLSQHPEVTVKLNGAVVDRFRTNDGYLERDLYITTATADRPNMLELSIDRTVSPRTGSDGRTLGLRLRYLAWGPTVRK
jgi:hypothetical protein